MTSTGRRCLMRAWFALILLIFIIPAALSSDPCQKPNPTTTVTENVSKGSMLLKINYTQNQNWTILEAAPNGYFKLNKGNTSFYLIAAKPLDYEELKGRGENMYVKLQCESEKYPPVPYKVYIILKEVNEFAPNFTQRVYNKTISENARIGDSVFLALPVASDKDYDDMLIFEAVTFSQGKNPLDGIASGKFKMTNYKTGLIVVDDHLDYEEQKQYIIKMVVKDSKGNQSSAKLIVNISDVDDLGPVFLPNPCTTESLQCQVPVIYHAHIKAADKGQLSILPNAVKAVDMEVNNYSIGYSFTEEDPTNIEKYFKIDARNAIITKEEDLPKNVTSSVNLFIKAEEQSTLKHSSVAILIIDILDRNSTIIVSTKPSDSLSVSKIQGYSADVFYGVLIPLVILVGALSLCIVVIVIKSRKTHLQNSVEDLKAKTDKSVVPSVVIQKTDSLLSRKSVKGTNRATVEIVENGITGVANQAFVPDAFPESGGEDGDNKRTEQLSTSTEDNDVHPRSSHSDHNMDEFGYCNLTSAGMYMAIGDLRKAGVDEEETARDGDIGNNYSTDTNSKDETDQSTSDVSESHNTLADELNGNDPDKATKAFSEDITDTSYLDRAPEVPTPDYILDDAQSQCEPKEITWVVPKTSGQVESEIIEFLLTPDFIENVSETLASSGSLSAGVAPQIEGPLESTDTTDGNHSDSISMTEKDKKNNDEDNLLPEWASKALQPTIRPISSREEFKSHLESLISAPPQLPPSKTLPSSLTPSLSSQSPVTTPKGKASPPPPPPQLPSSSTAEAPSASIPPSPPPLPPIQIMATHL